MFDRGPGFLPRVIGRGRRGRQVVKSHLPALIIAWRSDGVDCSWDKFFLGWWPLLFSLEWWGHFLEWGVWFPSYLPLDGADHI
jgi:hypothetical protein